MEATGATDAPPDTWANGYLADAAGTYKLEELIYFGCLNF
jgi:hypothetical protein